MKVRLKVAAEPGQVYEYPGNPRKNFKVITLDDGTKVIHLGRIRAVAGEPEHLKEHTVEILDDAGAIVYSITRPSMPWNQEWAWPFNNLTIKRTPADLVAARQSFKIGKIPSVINTTPRTFVYAGPGDAAGVTKYMPTTGLRDEIGWLTEMSAYWMNGGAATSMLAWASSSYNWPIALEDELVNLPPDLFLELFNMYDAPGYMAGKYIWKGPPDPAHGGYAVFGDDWVPQLAHLTDLLYHAVLATLNGGLLRKLQHFATFALVADTSKANAGGPVISSELRGCAWGVDIIVKAFAATKHFESIGALPYGCRPSSYWARLVDHTAEYFQSTMVGSELSATFGMCPPNERDGPWQRDYFTGASAFAVLNGFASWIPILLRNIQNVVARNSGKHGIPPGWGTGYYYDYIDYDGKPLKSMGEVWEWFYKREQDNVATAAGHGEIYTPAISTAQYNKLKADPLNKGVAMNGGEYNPEARTAMVMAATLEKLGLVNVRAVTPHFDLALQNMERMVRAHGVVYNRMSVEAPDPIVVPPLPTSPLAKRIRIMGKPFAVKVGQVVDLPITWDDGAGGPAELTGDPSFTISPAGAVSLAYTQGSLAVTGLVNGHVEIDVHGEGEGPLADSAQGEVGLPLARAIHINP